MLRLLEDYPLEALYLVYSRKLKAGLAETKLRGARQTAIPEIAGGRRYGLRGQLAMLVDRLLIPWHSFRIARLVKRWNAEAIISVAHGYLFLAAAVVARTTKRPLVLIVHDEWPEMEKHVRLFRSFVKPLFAWALRSAAVVYAVSEAMARHLVAEYLVQSELLLPSTMRRMSNLRAEINEERSGVPLQIAFAGMIYGTTTLDSLGFVIGAVRHLNEAKRARIALKIYSNYTANQAKARGWSGDGIHFEPWVPQEQIQAKLSEADVLLLPVSFAEEARYYSRTSFPSKLADYLATGRGVLVFAPPDSDIVSYTRHHGFGVVVTAADTSLLELAIEDLRNDIQGLQHYRTCARQTFELNHNLEVQRTAFHRRIGECARPVSDAGAERSYA